MQPRLRHLLPAVCGWRRNSKQFRCLVERHARKIAKFDLRRERGVVFVEPLQGLIEQQKLVGIRGETVPRLVERNTMNGAAAALRCRPFPCPVDQDLPHDTSRQGKEMLPVLKSPERSYGQPNVRFVDEHRRLQSRITLRSAQIRLGNPVQFVVKHAAGRVEGSRVAIPPEFQELRYIEAILRHSLILPKQPFTSSQRTPAIIRAVHTFEPGHGAGSRFHELLITGRIQTL